MVRLYAWSGTGVLRILGARAVDGIHVHHDVAWRENHDGTGLWVIRKVSLDNLRLTFLPFGPLLNR